VQAWFHNSFNPASRPMFRHNTFRRLLLPL
jgi:tRNA U34 5-methylaminomethyl-2-thiouridine-forming methyltransferase MnmC